MYAATRIPCDRLAARVSARRLSSSARNSCSRTESSPDNATSPVAIYRFPPPYDTWPFAARTARSVYFRAQYAT